ncbi:MAG: bifunctional sugar-1-phosphate nucleotidylyltransferase/acetyltransferase [Candidatus Micrarchaeota archaeon]
MDLVILAAGKGKRLWPITNHYPKTMLRLLEKPLLEWIIAPLFDGVNKVIVVVGVHKEKIIDYFKETRFAEKMVFVEDKELKGTGSALLQAKEFVSSDFFVVNGDNFFDPKLLQSLPEEASKGFFVAGKKASDVTGFGALVLKGSRIERIAEKTESGPGLINTNLSFLPKSFFSLLEETKLSPRGEYELTCALNSFAEKNELRALVLEDYWNDVGFYWNYLDANAFALENLLEEAVLGEVEEGVVVKGSVFVGEGSVVKAPCRIEGPVFIGKNCVVGPHAFLRAHAYVEDCCHIGSTEVKDSIVMRNTNAAHFSYIGDSVVCEEVNFGAGAKIANLRFDEKSVLVTVDEKTYDTGRVKLGAVVGANTKLGIDVFVSPGKIIGSDCRIYPNVVVKENVLDNTKLRGDFV